MTDPFVLDNWMLKFLIEQSAVLDTERWSSQSGQETSAYEVSNPEMGDLTPSNTMVASGSLSALVSDRNLSNDALIENALSWLLD